MSINIYFSLIIACVFNTFCVYGLPERCSDCKYISQCPAAVDLIKNLDKKSTESLRDAFCGYHAALPRVCCSKLGNKNLDDHPNLTLLPNTCGFITGDRIYGGTTAGLYEYPWMVLISYRTRDGLKFMCGGSLINNRYVLTAAHCIIGQKIAGVRIGEHDIRTKVDCEGEGEKKICESKIQDILIEEEIPHAKYQGKPRVRNDIGLLRLQTPVDFSFRNAKTICLPVTSDLRNRDVGRLNSTIAGWGYTETGYVSPVLLSARVSIYTKEGCRSIYNKGSISGVDETENKLCAGESGKDSCGGDSGGPLMVVDLHDNKERYVQRGIVSYGPRLCASNFPGVYTDVSKYMDWILDNIKA